MWRNRSFVTLENRFVAVECVTGEGGVKERCAVHVSVLQRIASRHKKDTHSSSFATIQKISATEDERSRMCRQRDRDRNLCILYSIKRRKREERERERERERGNLLPSSSSLSLTSLLISEFKPPATTITWLVSGMV